MHEVTITSLEELQAFARDFLERLPKREDATVVGLVGNLGAGKTAFTRALATELGITKHVTSPTFVLMKKYVATHEAFRELVHIDTYRLMSAHDLEVLRWRELLGKPGTLIVIEWPETVASLLPPHTIIVEAEFIDETTRVFRVLE